MKKLKLVFLLVILGLVAVIGYQNLGFLVVKHQFGINLGFVNYQSPEIQNVALLLGCLAVGFLLALILSLRSRWRSRRAIKELTGELTASREKIAAMEKELVSLKPAGPKSVEALEGNADVSS